MLAEGILWALSEGLELTDGEVAWLGCALWRSDRARHTSHQPFALVSRFSLVESDKGCALVQCQHRRLANLPTCLVALTLLGCLLVGLGLATWLYSRSGATYLMPLHTFL